MCTKNELSIILRKLTEVYKSVYGERSVLQEQLKQVWDISSDLELEYGTILSPTVIPYEEYIRYIDVLPYYKNIEKEGVEIVA